MSPPPLLLLLLLTSSSILVSCGIPPTPPLQPEEHTETGAGKAEALRRLANQSPDGVIKFNATGYRYFITEQPRPYEVILLFTISKKFSNIMQIEFKQTAQYYYKNKAHFAYNDSSKKLRAVFFGIMIFDEQTQSIFTDLEFKYSPSVLVSLPKHAAVPEQERLAYLNEFKWHVSSSEGHATFLKFLEYVNKITHRDITYMPTVGEVLKGLGMMVVSVVCIILIFRQFKSFFLNTKLWFFGSLMIYAISIAGFIFVILNNVPMTTIDEEGKFKWMVKGHRYQLGSEGFIMSMLFIIAGFSMMAWRSLTKLTSSSRTLAQHLAYLAAFYLTFYLITSIEALYKSKGNYKILFFPPDHYKRGHYENDQGNII